MMCTVDYESDSDDKDYEAEVDFRLPGRTNSLGLIDVVSVC